jgi:hypothetical protein
MYFDSQEWATHYEPNTMQTTMCTKLYHIAKNMK